jgi:hypothetical protein
MASAAVMAITKWSISGLEKSVPANQDNKESPGRAGALGFQ